MARITCVQIIWDRQNEPIRTVPFWSSSGVGLRAKFFPLYVQPEPEYPLGRKGFTLARAWDYLGKGKVEGMLILDADVAIDPSHVTSMFEAIESDCGKVWTAAVKIWPVSTHKADWTWAHWENEASQELDLHPKWFSFCFTYLPAALINQAITRGMRTWVYPQVDSGVSRVAQRMGMKAELVPDCFPIHTHW